MEIPWIQFEVENCINGIWQLLNLEENQIILVENKTFFKL